MRVDGGVDRLATMRARLGLPTPCPECANARASTYCDTCLLALSNVMGESFAFARATYGRKQWRTRRT
jgi:hypothetical protein